MEELGLYNKDKTEKTRKKEKKRKRKKEKEKGIWKNHST
jgi:hypothetical protein